MQDIRLFFFGGLCRDRVGLCRKGPLVAWSCATLQLEAGLKLHEDFDSTLHLVHQDRVFRRRDLIEALAHNLDQGLGALVLVFQIALTASISLSLSKRCPA